MSDAGSASPFPVKYEYSKKGKAEICTITWSFPEFLEHLINTEVREFRTPIVADQPASKFQLRILLFGKYNDLFEIYYLSPTSLDLETKISLTESNCNFNHKNQVASSKAKFQKIQCNKWTYLLKICKHDLNYINSELICRLELTLPSDALKELKNESPTGQHFEDFANLLSDETYSDVILKSVDGEECRAHKLILITRSKVLKAHFIHNTTEAVTNIIETPFEYEVLRDVLVFIYTSKSLHIDDIPDKLMAAADYYQLGALKSLCEESIYRRLTVENAIETLHLADLHSANFLKQSTLEFIKLHIQLIIKSEGWAKLQPKLVKEILEYIALSN